MEWCIWVSVQFELLSRSEGPEVSSPVREGGVDVTVGCLSAEGAPRFGAGPSGLWAIRSPPPSRTGLLTSGPSDLRHALEAEDTLDIFRDYVGFEVHFITRL